MKARTLRITASIFTLFVFIAGTAAHAGVKDDAVAASANYSSSISSADTLPEEPQSQSGVPPLQKPEKAKRSAPVPVTPEPVNTETPVKPVRTSVRPFSTVGIAVKMGIAGAGFDIAVPLARKFNLRGGASFFSFDHTFVSDGTNYNASLDFKSAIVALDWFPFGNSFRLSPIAQVYNGNTVNANTSVPAGQSFQLNDTPYFSSVGNPIHGTAAFSFGNQNGSKVAPGFTLGFGNMIPRGKGEHWSVPFEIGFVYIDAPRVLLNLGGISCPTQLDANNSTSATIPGPGCSFVATDPTTQINVQQEQVDIDNDLSVLRFYPVVSIGVSYKF